MSDFIESLRQQNTSEFQRLYRSADVLLVDDILDTGRTMQTLKDENRRLKRTLAERF
jgi:chromosomal replication initiation ATPase DnaA